MAWLIILTGANWTKSVHSSLNSGPTVLLHWSCTQLCYSSSQIPSLYSVEHTQSIVLTLISPDTDDTDFLLVIWLLKKLWLIVNWLSQTLQLSRDALHLRFHYTIPHILPNANFTCECNNSKGKSLLYCSFLGLKISLLKPDVPPAHLSCCGALLTQTDSLSCKKHFDLANFRIMKRRWYVLGDRCCAVTEGAVYVRTWLRFDAVRRRV